MKTDNSGRTIWMNGGLVPWADARIHVTSEALLRGASVFEGLRVYSGPAGSFLFRMPEHLARLRQSARVMRLPIDYSDDEITNACRELVRENRLETAGHLRIVAYFGEGKPYSWLPEDISSGLLIIGNPEAGVAQAVKDGIHSGVSTWRRNTDLAAPSRIKASANYLNSRYAMVEGKDRGFPIPLMLNHHGKVAESPSSCFFLVRNGALHTPSTTSDILESITRDTVIRLCRERLHLQVQEREIDRSEVYLGDEAFFCGSAHEIVPVLSMDGYVLGDGVPGAMTKAIQREYFDTVSGANPLYRQWLTPVASTA